MSDSKVNAALLSAARELNQYLAQREGGNLTMAGAVLKVITEALEEGLSSPAWSLIVGPPKQGGMALHGRPAGRRRSAGYSGHEHRVQG